MTFCPPAQQLTALLSDELSDADRTSIELHIEHCPQCQTTLERLTKDSLVQARRGLADEHPTSDLTPQRSPDQTTHTVAPLRSIEAGDELTQLEPYEVLGVLGRGGMGVVYKARHRKLDRVVALKVTRAGDLASEGEAKRFQVEAQAVAKLDHPHIVPIYDVGEVNGLHYYSMALVEGESLAQRVSVRPLPPRDAAQLMRQVAGAMAYAHAHGVIHRDLKPGNILLDAAGQPRVTDFGLAKRADTDSSLTQAGQVMGTPSYMPPEQAEGKVDQVGPLSDVYALGATLYCLLTGRPPFQAASVMDTLKQVVEREPLPPRQLNPAVDLDLDTICLKCLEKRPERRYPSAAALAEDLERFLDDRPIQARRVGELEKLARWCRRNRLLAGSLAAVVAIFLAAFALVSWSYFRAEDARKGEEKQRAAAQERAKAERWERYRANIAAAASALQLNNVQSARRSLEAAPEEHRNWEWRHFAAKLDATRALLHSDDNTIWLLPFHGSHLQYEATPKDGIVHLVDPVSGKEQGVLRTSNRKLTKFFPSPTGEYLVYWDEEGQFRHWDVRAGRETAAWRLPIGGYLFLSPDGRRLVLRTDDGTLRRLDVTDQHEATLFATNSSGDIGRYAFSADGRRFAGVLQGPRLVVWILADGRRVASIPLPDDKDIAFQVALAPDGARLATGGGYPDNAVRLWDVATGKVTAQAHGHQNALTQLQFSPDGSRIASSSMDQTVRLWEVPDLRLHAVLRGHTGPVNKLMFSPDGLRLLTACEDDRTLRLWDPVTGDPIGVLLGHQDRPISVAFSRDGAFVISREVNGLHRFWDTKLLDHAVLRGHTSYVYDVAVSPDGTQVASAAWDGTVRLWDLTTATQTACLHHEFGNSPDKIVGGVAFSPDGKLVASVPRNGTVCVWDLASGKLRHRPKASTGGYPTEPHAAFNRLGTLLAQGGQDGVVRLWDPISGAQVGELPTNKVVVTDVAFNPDGTVLAVADERAVRLWDVASRRQIAVLTGHTGVLERVTFSHDGRLIASCGRDKTARLWDAKTHQELATLSHGSALYSLAFSPDNTRLATACADNTIRLWDIATHQEVAELRGHTAYVHAVAFSPDGTRLISASGDFTMRVWDTLSAEERAGR